jgi:hypothetical protein
MELGDQKRIQGKELIDLFQTNKKWIQGILDICSGVSWDFLVSQERTNDPLCEVQVTVYQYLFYLFLPPSPVMQSWQKCQLIIFNTGNYRYFVITKFLNRWIQDLD